jgi:hypothetical protein
MKHLRQFNEQLDNHSDMEIQQYHEAIDMYRQAIDLLNHAYELFENSPWGTPEEFDRLFGDRQGNETLYTLEKEAEYLISEYLISNDSVDHE